MLDAVWRLFPEGLKVRYDLSIDKVMTIIGTEHDMKQEWVDCQERSTRRCAGQEVQ